MSKVLFASARMAELRADASLPAKMLRLLDEYPLGEMFEGRSVAIKMHVGGHFGYTTIPPLFVRLLAQKVKDAGGRPFVTDGSGAIPGAKARGYTEDVLGCPVVAAAGVNEGHYRTVPIGYKTLESVDVCGEIADAAAMIVYSHGKGHGNCGWGGAIKNIAMGNVVGRSRGRIHALMSTDFKWDPEKCEGCMLCRDNCPNGAISFDKDGKMDLFLHHCKYCMHCVSACPHGAIEISNEGVRDFQRGMALTTKACLDTFDAGHTLFVNQVTSVTPFCDCWGFSSPSIVPDVGIFASTDIVAVEQASIDSLRIEDFIEGSLPAPFSIEGEGHLLERIHAKDPYLQCEEAAKAGLGSQEYELAEVQ